MIAAAFALSLGLTGCADSPKPVAGETTEPSAALSVKRLTIPYRACNKPQIVGASLYMVVDLPDEAGSKLIRYTPANQKAETIVESRDPHAIGWFVVNDRWLLYTVDERLIARSLSTGTERVLADSRDLYAPTLNGDLAAWDDLVSDGSSHQVVMQDLTADESTVVAQVALADLYNNFPAWDEDRLVWSDVIDGVGMYRVFDATTATIQQYPVEAGPWRYPGYAQGSGKRIYSINFNDVREWNWAEQKAGYYLPSTGEFEPLVPDGTIVNSLDVAGGLVAVVDSAQHLTLRRAEAPDGLPYRPVPGQVDFVQSSADGSLIAWREARGAEKTCVLYLIKRR